MHLLACTSQLGSRAVELKYLIIIHGLGEGICCLLTPRTTQQKPSPRSKVGARTFFGDLVLRSPEKEREEERERERESESESESVPPYTLPS